MARKTYTDAKKNEIIAFATSQGRGGISLAMKKYGVSFGAIKAWLGGSQPRNLNKRISKMDGRKLRRIRTTLKIVKGIEKQANALAKILKGL